MIICGEVIVSIPNPKVENWLEQNNKFKELVEWNHHELQEKLVAYVDNLLSDVTDFEQKRKR